MITHALRHCAQAIPFLRIPCSRHDESAAMVCGRAAASSQRRRKVLRHEGAGRRGAEDEHFLVVGLLQCRERLEDLPLRRQVGARLARVRAREIAREIRAFAGVGV